jgi:hypothetical protein
MQALGESRNDPLDRGNLAAPQAFELDVRAPGFAAVASLLAGSAAALADIPHHARARTAAPALRLDRLDALDRTDLTAAQALEAGFLVAVRAHCPPAMRLEKKQTVHQKYAEKYRACSDSTTPAKTEAWIFSHITQD